MVEVTAVMVALILFVILLVVTLLLLGGIIPGFRLSIGNLTQAIP
jgi:uncharacterized protein YneF (UPF0154 family)